MLSLRQGGQEDCAARSEADDSSSAGNALPLIATLGRGESGVEGRHQVAETTAKTRPQLWRQRYLGHQDECCLALREHYGLPQHLEIIQVIALGKPAQKVRLTSIKANGDYHYYQDEEGTHWVPKRNLDEIIYKPGK